MNSIKVSIINIVPCFGVSENGGCWRNTAIVYIEKRKNSSCCRVDKGVKELEDEKLPSGDVYLLYDRYGRVIGWQSDIS